MTTTPSHELVASVVMLAQRGFLATHTYGDGVVRMAKAMPNGDESVAWVDAGGMKRAPHLYSDYRAVAHRRINGDSITLTDLA